MDPRAFAERLREVRASAILRTADPDFARTAMDAAVRGGFRVIEFTLTIPEALDLVAEYSGREDLVVGAGTVLSAGQARDAVRSGAAFIVSPVADLEVISAAREMGVAVMPGAYTPWEILAADRAGATMVKLFPAPANGPEYVRQVLGPLPHVKLVPTAGVDEKNAAEYLRAGAWAVGFTTSLFSSPDVEARAGELLAACRRG